MRRDWKRVVPTSLPEAFRLCKDHAIEKLNLSVERIAELMSVTPDALYKWLGTGRMPASLVPMYEYFCGIDFVTRYLVGAGGRLVIDMPTGRQLTPSDVNQLNQLLNAAAGAVIAYADGKTTVPQVLAEIEGGISALAWHHGNVLKSQQPELELQP